MTFIPRRSRLLSIPKQLTFLYLFKGRIKLKLRFLKPWRVQRNKESELKTKLIEESSLHNWNWHATLTSIVDPSHLHPFCNILLNLCIVLLWLIPTENLFNIWYINFSSSILELIFNTVRWYSWKSLSISIIAIQDTKSHTISKLSTLLLKTNIDSTKKTCVFYVSYVKYIKYNCYTVAIQIHKVKYSLYKDFFQQFH